jgi:hypothetical protein
MFHRDSSISNEKRGAVSRSPSHDDTWCRYLMSCFRVQYLSMGDTLDGPFILIAAANSIQKMR